MQVFADSRHYSDNSSLLHQIGFDQLCTGSIQVLEYCHYIHCHKSDVKFSGSFQFQLFLSDQCGQMPFCNSVKFICKLQIRFKGNKGDLNFEFRHTISHQLPFIANNNNTADRFFNDNVHLHTESTAKRRRLADTGPSSSFSAATSWSLQHCTKPVVVTKQGSL